MFGELFSDAKEVNEHALSVLLVQDEIAAVCAPESVRIYDFMSVKKFRTVQHLSTRFSGKLTVGATVWDAMKSVFPEVTVSGIEKAAALSLIARLEAEPRGIWRSRRLDRQSAARRFCDRHSLGFPIRADFQLERRCRHSRRISPGAGV
jgi:anthranilate/para-aminobenzoate synthase component I